VVVGVSTGQGVKNLVFNVTMKDLVFKRTWSHIRLDPRAVLETLVVGFRKFECAAAAGTQVIQ
jgi:hypothetical protein